MKLRPYQRLIADFILTHKRGAVFAGMGLGKTVSTLTALAALRLCEGEGPALVLAPLRVARSTWPDEIAKWPHLSDLRCSVICGTAKEREAALSVKADIYCMNYENLPWLDSYLKRMGKPWPFPIVVADEATRLKSFRFRQGGKRPRALANHYDEIDRIIELTGTPAPNGYLDLWGQFYFLDRGRRLGKSMRRYQETFFRPVRVGQNAFAVRWDILPGSEAEIQKRISDLVIRINTEDYFPVEKPVVVDVPVKMSQGAMDVYKRLKADFFVELDSGEVEAANAAVLTGKLLQAAGGAIYAPMADTDHLVDEPKEGDECYCVISDDKLDALESIVEEAAGAPVLVAYTFRHECKRILQRFYKARVLDKDPQTIRDWNAGRIPMLLAHPASCGHGLSLQDGGNILVFYSTGWDLEQHDQIIERIGPTRQAQAGHPRPVYIYNLIAKGTIDELVQERIKTKRRVLDIILERRHE